MKMRLYLVALLAFFLPNTKVLNASVIDDTGPNPMVVGKACGFMQSGNDGFIKPRIESLM